jgi:hypothetical protein
MRIIPDDVKAVKRTRSGSPENEPENAYWESDTIEITDAEWDEIWLDYEQESKGQGFGKYLRDLISLAGEGAK